MASSVRARVSIAVAAIALAALPLPAGAQSGAGESGRATPAVLLDPLDGVASGAVTAPRVPGLAPIDSRTLIEKAIADQTAAERENAISVPVDRGAAAQLREDNASKRKATYMHGLIDQYPENPRCYVEHHYIPAPPTCPD